MPFGVTALVTLRFRKLGSHRAKGKQWFNLIAEIVSASESLGSSLRAPPPRGLCITPRTRTTIPHEQAKGTQGWKATGKPTGSDRKRSRSGCGTSQPPRLRAQILCAKVGLHRLQEVPVLPCREPSRLRLAILELKPKNLFAPI